MMEMIVIGALTLDQLRMLAAVADTGSFSAAGRRLGRVQSAVSQSMQTLETTLGLSLFDRSAKVPALTEAGKVFVAQARQILLQVDTLESQAAAIASGLEPELTIAVDNLFPSGPLLMSLNLLRQQFPHLPVTLFTEPISASERRLREGAADIALCGLPPGVTHDLVAKPLAWIEMIPVAAPDHPLAQMHTPILRAALELEVQLILTDPAATGDTPNFGVVSPQVWRFVDLGRRMDFLKAGFGWGNMPAHIVAQAIQAGELVRLNLAEPNLVPGWIPMNAVHMRHRPPGPAGRWFLDQLLIACQGLEGVHLQFGSQRNPAGSRAHKAHRGTSSPGTDRP